MAATPKPVRQKRKAISMKLNKITNTPGIKENLHPKEIKLERKKTAQVAKKIYK